MSLFHRPLPRTLPACLRDLEDSKPAVRRSAIVDLGRYVEADTPNEVKTALIKALRDEDAFVRTEAAYCLGDCKCQDALAGLLVAVDDEVTSVRQAALDALGMLGDSRATGRLLRAAKDDRPDVRFQALIALSRLSRDLGIESVLASVHDPDAHVRYVAVRVTEELCTKEDSEELELEPRFTRLLENWMKDDDLRVRVAAAIVLGRAGNAVGASTLVRVVNESLGLSADDESAAVQLVGELGLRDAIPGLSRRAFGMGRFLKERFDWQARVSLARLGDERAISAILGGLQSWSRNQRTLAVLAAGKAGLTQAIEAIEAMRNDDRRADPESVVEALALLTRSSGEAGTAHDVNHSETEQPTSERGSDVE